MNPIRVLAIDDEPFWLKEISGIITGESDLLLAGTAEDIQTGLDLVTETAVDVVLLDLCLANDTYAGIHAIPELLKLKPVKIIVFSSYNESELVIAAFYAGAKNFISKQDGRDIPNRIRETYYNKNFQIDILIAEFKRMARELRLEQVLTPMERAVYNLKLKKYTYPQIADELKIEIRTVKNHINNYNRKLKGK